LSRKDLYRLRDESGLSRQEYYLKHARQAVFSEISEIDHTPDDPK